MLTEAAKKHWKRTHESGESDDEPLTFLRARNRTDFFGADDSDSANNWLLEEEHHYPGTLTSTVREHVRYVSLTLTENDLFRL